MQKKRYICHCMKTKTHLPLQKALPLLALVTVGCWESTNREAAPAKLPQELFREGDIVFRRGTGLTSRAVLAADREGAYSHIGILTQKDGQWHVIHAVPGEPDFKGDPDRVKMEDAAVFFEPEKAVSGAVMRVTDEAEAASRAALYARHLYEARVPFDHDYDLADTTRMYCTELVDFVYRKAGIDVPQGRISHVNIPGFRGDYLLPNDIVQSKRLCLIYNF